MDKIRILKADVDNEIKSWKQFLKLESLGEVGRGRAEGILNTYTVVRDNLVEITDEEIEKEANKQYPSHYTDWEDGIRKKAFMNAIRYIKSRINQ